MARGAVNEGGPGSTTQSKNVTEHSYTVECYFALSEHQKKRATKGTGQNQRVHKQ